MQQATSSQQPPNMDLLKVPEVDTKMEGRPMSDEDMEDVGRRYRERRRQYKLSLPSIQYLENCRLVRSGTKQFDDHCLPTTISGEIEELLNMTRRDNFLVYLQCWELCEAYGLPLTEDILMRALLYPGDRIISLKEEVRPIRQPGGYYIDHRIVHSLAGFKNLHKRGEKETDKLSFKPPLQLRGLGHGCACSVMLHQYLCPYQVTSGWPVQNVSLSVYLRFTQLPS